MSLPAEKSLKTMGDEMQVDLEDAEKKEAEEKEVNVLTCIKKIGKAGNCHGNRLPWQSLKMGHKLIFQQET